MDPSKSKWLQHPSQVSAKNFPLGRWCCITWLSNYHLDFPCIPAYKNVTKEPYILHKEHYILQDCN